MRKKRNAAECASCGGSARVKAVRPGCRRRKGGDGTLSRAGLSLFLVASRRRSRAPVYAVKSRSWPRQPFSQALMMGDAGIPAAAEP